MSRYDYDLFIIGAGSAGVRAARVAAGLGARVGIAEARYFGGTCVNVGCVPKKLLFYASHYREDFQDALRYGWRTGDVSFDWQRLIAAKNQEIARLNSIYEGILLGAGCAIHKTRATLLGPQELDVGGQRITAEHILIATGSWPTIPPIPGQELGITSNEIFFLPELPRRCVIVGGGYIGLEMGSILNGFGVDVTIVHRCELPLRGFDQHVRACIAEELEKKGIRLRPGLQVAAVTTANGFRVVQLTDGSSLETDAVLFATGRAAATAGLGLEQVGVELDARGAIKVDPYYRSSVPSIHAVGDVIHRVQLTPVALAEATVLATNLFGGQNRVLDYDYVPSAVFSQPTVGAVGLTEEQARLRYPQVRIFLSRFTPLKHTLTHRDERALVKLVVDAGSDRVVGAHMVGADAAEIIQGLAIAIRAGATKADFDTTLGVHPTAAEEFVTLREPLT